MPDKAKIAGGPSRSKVVKLTWPVEYDGTIYDQITVRRLTVGEIDDHLRLNQDLVNAGTPPKYFRWPMFDVPEEVLVALDPDDEDELNKVAEDFLPRRLKAARDEALAEAATASPSANSKSSSQAGPAPETTSGQSPATGDTSPSE